MISLWLLAPIAIGAFYLGFGADAFLRAIFATEWPRGDALLRRSEVLAYTGMSQSAMYRAIAVGTFPAPVRAGPRSVRWRFGDVEQWVQTRARVEVQTDWCGWV